MEIHNYRFQFGKMRLSQLIVAFYLLLFFLSCSKEKLEIKPSSSTVVPTTLTDFQALLDNTDIMNAGFAGLGEISSDNIFLTTTNYIALTSIQEKNAYIWNKAIFEGESSFEWARNYRCAFYTNVIFEGLNKIPVTASNKNQIEYITGQALFFRAFVFSQIADLYAKQYDKNTVNTSDLGIPLRLTAEVNSKTNRSTLQETYDKIIGDLTLAKSLLQDKAVPQYPLNKTRPGVLAVNALLARIYLIMGNYDSAFDSADSYLQANSTLIDFNTLSLTSSFPFSRFNVEDTFHCTLSNLGALFQSRASIDPTLIMQYDNNDLRKLLYFKSNNDGTNSFKGSYDGTGNPLFGGLATDEVLLIRAECFARKGNSTLALKDLNMLLTNRFKTGTYSAKANLSANESLIEILKERRKELVFRGTRWSDLRRLNLESQFRSTLTRTVNGQTYILQPNDSRYVFPIPDDVLYYNIGMPQNIR